MLGNQEAAAVDSKHFGGDGMKRLTSLMLCCVVLMACHPWTGITTTQLAKKMGGPPRAIRTSGAYKVYIYRDPMGGGQLSFFVDKDGIVRKWTGAPVGGTSGGDAGEGSGDGAPAP